MEGLEVIGRGEMKGLEVIGQAGIEVKMIADSISPSGVRLTTMQLKYHRYIHSELMTHRVFSRNASSSRAIPVETMLKQVREKPMMPIHWGSNRPGMQAGDELVNDKLRMAKNDWLDAAINACESVENLQVAGLHKQVANRLLEPFLAIHVVVTATEWSNWFKLRDHKDAQPEIQELARCMSECMAYNTPENLGFKDWHLPYVSDREIKRWFSEFKSMNRAMSVALRSSVARCARVSYLNHDKSNCTLEGDFSLYNMLSVRPYDDGKGHVLGEGDPVHMSPLEHQASPMGIILGGHWPEGVTHKDRNGACWSGNLRGWKQFRQLPLGQGDFENEIK